MLMSRVAAMCVVAALFGCASSHVLVGQARPAISPDQVKIYLRPPAKFEEVAILEATSRSSCSFGSQGKVNAVVQRLKAEAASLGANGILFQGTHHESAGSVSYGGATTMPMPIGGGANTTGYGISTAATYKAGSGIAIFVDQE